MSVAAENALARARAALGERARPLPSAADGIPALELQADELADAARLLRERGGFESVTFITAIDRYPAEPRFEVVHQLHSLAHGARLRLVTRVGAERPAVSSVAHVWPGAGFMERECFDMFGIGCAGRTGPRRLYMPEEYEHHPLRKDFPHQGIEPDRLYRDWDARRREWDARRREAAR